MIPRCWGSLLIDFPGSADKQREHSVWIVGKFNHGSQSTTSDMFTDFSSIYETIL
jgi:hypothetical protein